MFLKIIEMKYSFEVKNKQIKDVQSAGGCNIKFKVKLGNCLLWALLVLPNVHFQGWLRPFLYSKMNSDKVSDKSPENISWSFSSFSAGLLFQDPILWMSWQKLIKSKNDLPVLSWKAHLGLGWLSGQWPESKLLQNLMDQHLRRESWGICGLQNCILQNCKIADCKIWWISI